MSAGELTELVVWILVACAALLACGALADLTMGGEE